jgi:superfamily II DNA/RNA helicase
VEAVINYDAPAQLASYLHRVGRTARAGAKGRALTFAEDDDRQLLKEVRGFGPPRSGPCLSVAALLYSSC